ncbi:MAG: hypothetical protein JO097_04225 [Acidobacteriaceae bacterium]|nr:hypothetical protein [Acidobacteriaceae bacterium]
MEQQRRSGCQAGDDAEAVRSAGWLKRCDDRPRGCHRVITRPVIARTRDYLPALLVPPAGLQAEAIAAPDHIDTMGPIARVDAVDHFLAGLVSGHPSSIAHRLVCPELMPLPRADLETAIGPL